MPTAWTNVHQKIPVGRVMVVDDNDDFRWAMAAALRLKGISHVPVASAEEALATVDEFPPDILLADMMLPGMAGDQLITAIGKRSNPPPPVLISCSCLPGLRKKAAACGARAFWDKVDITPEALPSMLLEVAERKTAA